MNKYYSNNINFYVLVHWTCSILRNSFNQRVSMKITRFNIVSTPVIVMTEEILGDSVENWY